MSNLLAAGEFDGLVRHLYDLFGVGQLLEEVHHLKSTELVRDDNEMMTIIS